MSLYTLDAEIANFSFEVDEETGEVLNLAEFEALGIERNEKIDNIACLIKNLLAEEETIKAESDIVKKEVDALKKRAEQKHKSAEYWKRYLAMSLKGEKFESARCKISYRKTQRTEVSDNFVEWAKTHAPDLLCTKTTYDADKDAIKEAIKGGREVVGAEIVENVSLQVK